jgi:hypothetical protein
MGMWHRVGYARTDVSEECVATIFRVETIRVQREALAFGQQQSANSFLHHIDFFYPEDGGDTCLENVGSYTSHMAPHPRGTERGRKLDGSGG